MRHYRPFDVFTGDSRGPERQLRFGDIRPTQGSMSRAGSMLLNISHTWGFIELVFRRKVEMDKKMEIDSTGTTMFSAWQQRCIQFTSGDFPTQLHVASKSECNAFQPKQAPSTPQHQIQASNPQPQNLRSSLTAVLLTSCHQVYPWWQENQILEPTGESQICTDLVSPREVYTYLQKPKSKLLKGGSIEDYVLGVLNCSSNERPPLNGWT